jgi:hypothetical protein
MQKKLIFSLFLVFVFSIFDIRYSLFTPIHAASPSPLPSPSPASIEEVTASLKERLQNSLQDPNNPTASPSATSYVGTVTDVVGGTVVISDKDGKKDIKLADDTTILRSPGNKEIKAEDIRIDDSMIAIGYPAGTNVLNGKRLVVSTVPFPTFSKTSNLGVIKSITKTAMTLTIGDQTQVVSLTGKTIYKSSVGTINPADLELGDTVVYTATLDDSGAQTASNVMRILSTSTSAPSATPSASHKASVTK